MIQISEYYSGNKFYRTEACFLLLRLILLRYLRLALFPPHPDQVPLELLGIQARATEQSSGVRDGQKSQVQFKKKSFNELLMVRLSFTLSLSKFNTSKEQQQQKQQ